MGSHVASHFPLLCFTAAEKKPQHSLNRTLAFVTFVCPFRRFFVTTILTKRGTERFTEVRNEEEMLRIWSLISSVDINTEMIMGIMMMIQKSISDYLLVGP